MNIQKANTDGCLTVIPEGRLDSLSAGDLEAVLEQELNDGIRSLTLDLGGVDFVSSRGLRVLVSAYKRMNGRPMKLTQVNRSVMEVLRLSGLLKIFTVSE